MLSFSFLKSAATAAAGFATANPLLIAAGTTGLLCGITGAVLIMSDDDGAEPAVRGSSRSEDVSPASQECSVQAMMVQDEDHVEIKDDSAYCSETEADESSPIRTEYSTSMPFQRLKRRWPSRKQIGKALVVVGVTTLVCTIGLAALKYLHLVRAAAPGAIKEAVDTVDLGPAVIKEFPVLSKTEIKRRLVSVDRHLRKLPDGWQASPEKKAEAAILGIFLPDGFTIVDAYKRSIAVAA